MAKDLAVEADFGQGALAAGHRPIGPRRRQSEPGDTLALTCHLEGELPLGLSG